MLQRLVHQPAAYVHVQHTIRGKLKEQAMAALQTLSQHMMAAAVAVTAWIYSAPSCIIMITRQQPMRLDQLWL